METLQPGTSPAPNTAATDVDGDTLTYTWLAVHPWVARVQPDGSFSYSPDANYNRSDSFTFKANDGTVDNNIVPSRSPSPR